MGKPVPSFVFKINFQTDPPTFNAEPYNKPSWK